MTVDLHCHTTASDGTDSPQTLVDLAIGAGLGAIAVTDHDTQLGVAAAIEAAEGTGLEIVPGVELSLDHEPGGMHLVVLWLEPGPGALQARLEELREGRNERNSAILEKLVEHGIHVTEEEILEEAALGSVGRPHIAAVMMKKGYVPDIRTAFDQWLGSGQPAYVARQRLKPETAIELALDSGGVPVLAHPHTLGVHTAGGMARLLDRLVDAGLLGLEAVYSSYRQHERDGYADLARRFGLVPSGGSDYHGAYKPGLELGKGYGDLSVPASTLEELRSLKR